MKLYVKNVPFINWFMTPASVALSLLLDGLAGKAFGFTAGVWFMMTLIWMVIP